MHSRVQRDIMVNPYSLQIGQPYCVDNLPKAYAGKRHDGTLAGLLIGTIAGVVAAVMLGGQLF
jgi:hypothetical protein